MSTINSETSSGKPSYKDKTSKGTEAEASKRANRFKKSVVRQPKFEGKCEELHGHVYDCTDSRQSDQFTKTTKEVAEYIGRTYRYGGDARLAVEKLKKPVFDEPRDPPEDANKKPTLKRT